MPGRQDIEAGSAFVRLYAKDGGLKKGLDKAKAALKVFATASIAAGGAIFAAAKKFADAGSEIADASARMGIGTKALQEFKHAAEQTGASVDNVETAIKKMQKTIGDAAAGSESAAKALGRVGLSVADLQGMTPEDQFAKIAEHIKNIPDPTERSAAAMLLFGRSGTMLLPMLNDLEALREEAHKLGIVLSEEQVKAADEMGDAMDRAEKAVGGLVVQLGAMAAPAIIAACEKLAGVFGDMATTTTAAGEALTRLAAGGGAVPQNMDELKKQREAIQAEQKRLMAELQKMQHEEDTFDWSDLISGWNAPARQAKMDELVNAIDLLGKEDSNLVMLAKRLQAGKAVPANPPPAAPVPAPGADAAPAARFGGGGKMRGFKIPIGGIEAGESNAFDDFISSLREEAEAQMKSVKGGGSSAGIVGSFSAAALQASAGRSPVQETNKILSRQEKIQLRMQRALEEGGRFV